MKKLLYGAAAFVLPALASAQIFTGTENAQTFFDNVKTNIVNPIITLLAVAAFVVFVWGVVDFIRSADDAEKRGTGQQHMIWGIIGLVIIFGANAIIGILKNTFGF
jgi:hypothetical protein